MANSTIIYNWYCEKLEDPQELAHYLSSTSTLIWFGRVFEGRKTIISFIKKRMSNIAHVLKPVNNGRYRAEDDSDSDEEMPKVLLMNGVQTGYCVTPEKKISSVIIPNISYDPMEIKFGSVPSAKEEHSKIRLMKNAQMKGVLQLWKESHGTSYDRPCQLIISYLGDVENNLIIKKIVYQDRSKCRKSLLAEFDNCFDDEGFISDTN